MTDLVDVTSGDLITSASHNLIKDYINDGTHKINTLSVDIGGTEVIASKSVLKLNGSTSGVISVTTAAEAGTWSLTLPVNDGDASQVLTTNGSGVTSWTTPSGGGASMVFERHIEGDLYTTTLMPIVISGELNGLDIKEVRLALGALPTGADVNVDVRKNGTASTNSIFTSDVPIKVGTGQTATNGLYQTACDDRLLIPRVGTPGTSIDSTQATVAMNDVLWIVITQVGSTLAGTDFSIFITVE
jgi:hypothetical protein